MASCLAWLGGELRAARDPPGALTATSDEPDRWRLHTRLAVVPEHLYRLDHPPRREPLGDGPPPTEVKQPKNFSRTG